MVTVCHEMHYHEEIRFAMGLPLDFYKPSVHVPFLCCTEGRTEMHSITLMHLHNKWRTSIN